MWSAPRGLAVHGARYCPGGSLPNRELRHPQLMKEPHMTVCCTLLGQLAWIAPRGLAVHGARYCPGSHQNTSPPGKPHRLAVALVACVGHRKGHTRMLHGRGAAAHLLNTYSTLTHAGVDEFGFSRSCERRWRNSTSTSSTQMRRRCRAPSPPTSAKSAPRCDSTLAGLPRGV